MNKDIEVLKSILGGFFKDQFYQIGIERLKAALKENSYYKDNWEKVVKLILMKGIPDGQALHFLENDANLPLHEDSDNEAYKWLVLMIVNASKPKGCKILDYKDFLDPDNRI